MNHEEDKHKLSIPAGDTGAGPYNLTVDFLGMLESPEPDIIPLINSIDVVNETGVETSKV